MFKQKSDLHLPHRLHRNWFEDVGSLSTFDVKSAKINNTKIFTSEA